MCNILRSDKASYVVSSPFFAMYMSCGAVFIQDITFFFDVTKCFVTKPVIEAALKEKLSMFLKKKRKVM